jgi:23S rRNA pseudouridine955/2504/2580 synthase
MKKVTIGKNEAGQRLDRFLLKYLNNSSRTNVYKLIRKKVFKVNGVRVKENYFFELGDELEIYLSDESFDKLVKPIEQVEASEVGLKIVYEDDDILIVDKPKGMLTHPDKNEFSNTLSSKVQVYLKHISSRTFKPASIQRLDKNTSGLVIFGKNYQSLKAYNEKMRNREIKKYYQCVVEGVVKEPGTVKGWLVKDEQKNKVRLSKKDQGGGAKYCHTDYRPLETVGGYTLLEVELHTGRSHQIRESMRFIGHPIVGDKKYGASKEKNVNSQLLHGYKLIIEDNEFVSMSEDISTFMESIKKNSRRN